MPAQETALASSANDEVQTTPLQNQEDEDAEIFELRAEGDVLKRSGGPRILKLSKLNTKNIAYIAKNHELADIIVTLVYHVSGPRRVEELTRNPNFANSKNYESGCNFTTSQIRGSASTKENMAFELYRGGNEVMVRWTMCRCPPRGISYEHRGCERFNANINIKLSNEDRTWDITSIKMGSVVLTYGDNELLKAASVMAAAFILDMLVGRFTIHHGEEESDDEMDVDAVRTEKGRRVNSVSSPRKRKAITQTNSDEDSD